MTKFFKKIDEILVSRDDKVREVISVIDKSSKGIALVADDRRLIATITDGDIRRAILDNFDIDNTVNKFLERAKNINYKKPVSVNKDASQDVFSKTMQENSIHQLPLIDENDIVHDLVTMDELLPDSNLSVDAVVMAGGLGTRLNPLTQETTKPMLPVGDKPLLQHIVEQLNKSNIQKITISTNYLADKIKQYFGDGQEYGLDIDYLSESKPLGTAGALVLLDKPEKTTLLINGDVLTNINIASMVDFHRKHNSIVTMAVRQYDMKVPYGVVECEDVFVTEITEKPVIPFFVNAGIYLIEPEAFLMISEDEKFDMTELIEALKKDNKTVVAFPIHEYWLDIGQLADYEQAQKDITNGELN